MILSCDWIKYCKIQWYLVFRILSILYSVAPICLTWKHFDFRKMLKSDILFGLSLYQFNLIIFILQNLTDFSLKCLPRKHDVGHSGRSKFYFGLKTLRSLYIRCWWDHICKSVQAVWGITDSGWPIQLVPCSRRKLIVSSLQSCSGTCRTLSQYVLVAIFRQSLAW